MEVIVNETETAVPLAVKLKNTFFQWLESSTSHGLPNIARSRNWFIRIMWLIFFLVSTCYCFSVIITCILNYLKNEVTVSFSKVHELPTTFPAITICNVNSIDDSSVYQYISSTNETIDYYDCLTNNTNNGFNCSSDYTSQGVEGFVDVIKRIIAESVRINGSLSESIGFNLKSSLIGCKFNFEECKSTDFSVTWNNQYGNCYTFNSERTDELKQTSSRGQNFGLSLELAITKSLDSTFSYKTGLALFVHNQSSNINTLQNGFNIQTGYETYVGINRVFSNRLGDKYSNCISDLTTKNSYAQKLFGYFKALNVTYYDQDFCFNMCYQDKLIDTCNCSDIITPAIRDSSFCISYKDLECMKEFMIKFRKSNLNIICESACAEECSTIEYNLMTSLSSYPTLTYLNNLKTTYQDLFLMINNTNLMTFAKQSLVRLVINYEDLFFMSIDETPKMTLEDLLGNLGGQLGLFIGISFLSLIEILELLSEFIIIFITHRQKNLKVDLKNP